MYRDITDYLEDYLKAREQLELLRKENSICFNNVDNPDVFENVRKADKQFRKSLESLIEEKIKEILK